MKQKGIKPVAQNKKARFNYTIEESIECGIELRGTEIKSFRDSSISFPDAFAEIIAHEVWVKNLHISENPYSSIFNHDPDRPKKLLLHRNEIRKLDSLVMRQGYTLVPLEMYLKDGKVKIQLGLCKGKQIHDKRESMTKKDSDREIQRALRQRQK